MDSIIGQLSSQKVWEEFLAYRLVKGRFNWHEFEEADEFVEQEDYISAVHEVVSGNGLGVPHRMVLNKMGTGKKRIVYSYGRDEMAVLKLLAHLLYKYDDSFSPNCYAFRRGVKATDAVTQVSRIVRGKNLWAYKLDISNYFNSISVPLLLEQLKVLLADDPRLYDFFNEMLSDDRAEFNGEIIHEPRGAMAGVPTASFLANVYLMAMDWYFHDQGVIYARYSDDIIVFAEDYETLKVYIVKLKEFISKFRLEVNESKEKIFRPSEPYEFLGFKCLDNQIDIADSALDKMKGKIRRKMKAILRWKQRNGISDERAMRRFIDYFNRRFYDDFVPGSLSWARWYFPMVNTTDGLKAIDHYFQQCVRALSTGRHSKANFRVSYDKMKKLGLRSLVHEYYNLRKGLPVLAFFNRRNGACEEGKKVIY